MKESKRFSQKISVFHDRMAPEEGYLVGYGLLVAILESEHIKVPLPDRLSLISDRYRRYQVEQWDVFTPRHKPASHLAGHLVFALKYEGVDLYILKVVFQHFGADEIRRIIESEPTGRYSKRLWFLFEWLLNTKLEIPDLQGGSYTEVIDPRLQYPGPSRNSTRHRVRNNLPGTPWFCPLIRRTEKLEYFISLQLNEHITQGLGHMDPDFIRRAAASLLLKDSRASFAIEGEFPTDTRARNWGKIIGQAGKNSLSIKEIERLQQIVIGPKKLKYMGLRTEGGFIGEHDSDTLLPIPDHISARAKDLPQLMQGLIETEALLRNSDYDPVLAAATIAFGFVFIHPLLDGNGRIHRYLIHHLLINMGYLKRDMIFPISASMLNNLSGYQDILEVYSFSRLDLIEWEPTEDHNVRVLSETIDLYRYYDLTKQAEYLYHCVQDTIEHIIPREVDYLRRYDKTTVAINEIVSLPDHKVDLLIKVLRQNHGKLSKNQKVKFFDELTNKEIETIEMIYNQEFSTH
jgi:Fic family protein